VCARARARGAVWCALALAHASKKHLASQMWAYLSLEFNDEHVYELRVCRVRAIWICLDLFLSRLCEPLSRERETTRESDEII
jgi:hypothetical protein